MQPIKNRVKNIAKVKFLHVFAIFCGLLLMGELLHAAPYLLVIYVSGGWDPTMVFDPKIGSSTVAQETGSSLVVRRNSLSCSFPVNLF